MIINSFKEADELAQETVLFAMKNQEDDNCFFGPQGLESIFFKVYADLYRHSTTLASYFALKLKETYEIPLAGLT